jgi:hypothetical protein
MCRAMDTSAERNGSLKPHANISSSWSCNSLVRLGPTDEASMPMHWKIGSSDGAFFLLLSYGQCVLVNTVNATYPRS